jgi:hypothetical protein
MEFRQGVPLQIRTGGVMRNLFQFLILLLVGASSRAQPVFQLAPPLLRYQTVFFKKEMAVPILFAQAGTEIRYTTNGDEPTAQSKLFQTPIQVTQAVTTIKAKTFGAGFSPSETTQATFIKDGLEIDSINVSPPEEPYMGNGAATLFDNEGGVPDAHSKNWLGYRQDSVVITILLHKESNVRSVLLHFLNDAGSWIFLPQYIQVYYEDAGHGDLKKFAEKENFISMQNNSTACIYRQLSAGKTIRTRNLKIILKPVATIPEGYAGSGQRGWLFIDEIKVY